MCGALQKVDKIELNGCSVNPRVNVESEMEIMQGLVNCLRVWVYLQSNEKLQTKLNFRNDRRPRKEVEQPDKWTSHSLRIPVEHLSICSIWFLFI